MNKQGGELRVRWSGGDATFEPGRVVRIGRDSGWSDLTLDDARVSRRHAQVTWDEEKGWFFEDLNSSGGSHRDGKKISQLWLSPGQVELGLGVQSDSRNPFLITLSVAATELTETQQPTLLRNSSGQPATKSPAVEATSYDPDRLWIESGDRSYAFSKDQRVSIGRAPECDVVIDNPAVSRAHVEVRHEPTGWILSDLGSSHGMSHKGRRRESLVVGSKTVVRLGGKKDGSTIVLRDKNVAQSLAAKTVSAATRPLALISAAALLVVVVGFVLLQDRGIDRDLLARGVVRIEMDDGAVGSGTIIDANEGLILTNAHVVAPRAPGQGLGSYSPESSLRANPRTIVIWVSRGVDRAAEPRFLAEVVAADGYLDLAVLRITRTVAGSIVEPGDLDDLVEVRMADSDSLITGDEVLVVGYPAVSPSNASTFTQGIVAGTVPDERLSVNRAYLNIDAEVNPGNSGGLAVDKSGSMVGVPSLNWVRSSSRLAAMRPVNFARPLVDAALTGTEYESPYVTVPTGEEVVLDFGSVASGRQGFEATCESRPVPPSTGDSSLALSFNYEGFGERHVDLRIDIVAADNDEIVGTASSADQWPFVFGDEGCATVTVILSKPLAAGQYFIDVFVGPNYKFLDSLQFEL